MEKSHEVAQGAQAGDERVAKAIYDADRSLFMTKHEYADLHPQTKTRLLRMARAALATQPAAGEPVACRHRLADARNKHIASGYFCVDCGAAFAAADHVAPPAAAHGDEAVLPEAVELLISKGELLEADTLAPASAYRLVNAEDYRELREAYLAMRAQDDGEVQ